MELGARAGESKEPAELAREALALAGDAAPERRAVLEEAAALYDFLAARPTRASRRRPQRARRRSGSSTR